MSLQDIHDIYAAPHIKSVEIKVSDGSTLGNKDIVTEKFELQDSLNSSNELIFGSCEAACLKIQIAAPINKVYKDLWLDVWATIQDDSGDLMIDGEHFLLLDDGSKLRMHPYIFSQQVGRFKVVLDEPVSDRSWRNLTCYDQMYDVLRTEVADWYTGLTFPMTVKQFRDSFFSYLGIEQEEVTLINDSLSIKGDFVASSKLTGRPIIKAICEINGVFGHFNKDGKMDYISIPSAESVEYPYYRDGTGSYERDMVEPITGIIARDSEDDAGTTVGTTVNPYVITGNPLVYGIEGTQALEDALTALLAKIGGITYRPFAVTSFGNPALPIGTTIELNTRDITINSFIETRRLTGVQGLKDTISAKGNKERLNDTIDLSSELYQTDGRYHILRNDVNGLESEVYDEHGNSVISQMADEVVLKVDSNGKVVNVALTAEATGSAFKVLADNIDFISDGKIQLTSKSLEINSTNFSVTSAGSITAKAGTIGGWTITTNALYNGMTSLSDTTHDGVWLGQDGIALGKGNFKVTKAGVMTCQKANFYTSGKQSVTNYDLTVGLTANGLTMSCDSGGTNYSSTGVGSGSIFVSSGTSNTNVNIQPSSINMKYGVETYRVMHVASSGGIIGEQQLNPQMLQSVSDIYCTNLKVYGTKSRGVITEDYGARSMYCYETPTPLFGDVGEGVIAEDGKCYIMTESVFAQTINENNYQVFLQKYGEGECYVTERKSGYFIVEGTVGLKFGWEIKAKQAGFEMYRLDADKEKVDIFEYQYNNFQLDNEDFGADAIKHFENISGEREVA